MRLEIKKMLLNNKLIHKTYIFILGIKYLRSRISIIQNDQSVESQILQISHRLERGLCLNNKKYKIHWGFNKANTLLSLICKQKHINNNDSIKIGEAVLSAFVQNKENYGAIQETDALNILNEKMRICEIKRNIDSNWGGTMRINRNDVILDASTHEIIFSTRHSCRDFSKEPVDREKILKAVELANRAPSSCNRQASIVYVLDAKDRQKITGENILGADKYLIICGKIDSFSIDELNDWIVSSSIFAGYLSMALHVVGIGSVFLRKEIIKKSSYNEAVRQICKIPNNHEIIIELAVGNYADDFLVPISKRRALTELIHFND